MDNPGTLKQTISFEALGSGSLSDLLALEPPPFRTKQEAFDQLKYVEDYIRRPDLAPVTERCVAIESHYIDRDFITDHSVLLSRNLDSPPNYCSRVHFFASDPDNIERELRRLASLLHKGGDDAAKQFEKQCHDFSVKHYLGFTVIRPLPACRVGRTVLHLLPSEKKEDNSVRVMSCTRNYDVHFMGVQLTIRGLAFQQQDLGVSRCSTVALWCALHKLHQTEGVASPTPSEITRLASKDRLPFGRSMPSEGLAVDQMCLAVQLAGASPELARVGRFSQGRSLIYSATLSEMPSILIMERSDDKRVWHAVTVTGMKIKRIHEPFVVAGGDDLSADLKALYVHDDRIGPYRRAELVATHPTELRVTINRKSHAEEGSPEDWIVHHVLVPTHPKIRINFNDLRFVTQKWLIPDIQKVVAGERGIQANDLPAVQFKSWFVIERPKPATSGRLKTSQL